MVSIFLMIVAGFIVLYSQYLFDKSVITDKPELEAVSNIVLILGIICLLVGALCVM